MPGENYYLLSALPGLEELGSTPPLTLTELLEHVAPNRAAQIILQALFLGDDLLQRRALINGEIDKLDLAVLSQAQARDEEPMPNYLVINQEKDSRHEVILDHISEAYCQYVDNVAREYHSKLLKEYLGYEVALRNALTEARAKSLELDPVEYMVVSELGDDEEDFSNLLNEWSAASDPLAGLRVLDKARWDWLGEHDQWFSFGNDELVAYGAKLMLLRRWQRISAEPKAVSDDVDTHASRE